MPLTSNMCWPFLPLLLASSISFPTEHLGCWVLPLNDLVLHYSHYWSPPRTLPRYRSPYSTGKALEVQWTSRSLNLMFGRPFSSVWVRNAGAGQKNGVRHSQVCLHFEFKAEPLTRSSCVHITLSKLAVVHCGWVDHCQRDAIWKQMQIIVLCSVVKCKPKLTFQLRAWEEMQTRAELCSITTRLDCNLQESIFQLGGRKLNST